MRFNRDLGFLLLGVYLILVGLASFINLGNIAVIVAVLAIAAGILILIDR